jgi:hypothetical protein
MSGEKIQSFRCEMCEEDEKRTAWIDTTVREFFDMKDAEDCKRANALIDALVMKVRESEGDG